MEFLKGLTTAQTRVFRKLPPATQSQVTHWLRSIRPTLHFLRGDAHAPVPSFAQYAFVVVSVVLTSLVLGRLVWRPGTSLNKFVTDQYRRIRLWTVGKYVALEREALQTDLTVEQRRKQWVELNNPPPSSWWQRILGTVPTSSTSTLLSLSAATWALPLLLRLDWQQTLLVVSVGALYTMAQVLKRLHFVYVMEGTYWPVILNVIRSLPRAFLELLQRRITTSTDDDEINQLKQDLALLKEARTTVFNKLNDLNAEDLEKWSKDPISTLQTTKSQEEKFKNAQRQSDAHRTEVNYRISDYEDKLSTVLDLNTRELSGIYARPNLDGGVARKISRLLSRTTPPPLPLNPYQMWSLVAHTVVQTEQTARKVYASLKAQGSAVDTQSVDDSAKKRGGRFLSTPWNNYIRDRERLVKTWEGLRDELVNLRNYLQHHYIPTCETTLLNLTDTLASEQLSPSRFVEPTDLQQLRDFRAQLSQSPTNPTPAEVDRLTTLNDEVKAFLSALDERTSAAYDAYKQGLNALITLQTQTSLLCRALCRLLQFSITSQDAFDVAVKSYEKNRPLETLKDVWTGCDGYRQVWQLLQLLKEDLPPSSPPSPYVTMEDALKFYDNVHNMGTFATYLRHVQLHLCRVLKADTSPSVPSKTLADLRRIYGLKDNDCPEEKKEDCNVCDCHPSGPESPMTLPSLPRNTTISPLEELL